MPMTLAFPPDPVLGGALDALDERIMAPILQREILDEEGAPRRWHLDRCEIGRVNYQPHKTLRISYRLSVRDAASGAVRSHLVTSRFYPTGRGAGSYRRASGRNPVAVEIGRPVSLVPGLDAVLWGFPNDSKLTNLQHLLDETWVRNHGLAPVDGLGGGDHLRIEPVQYVPNHSFTVRVHTRSPGNGRRRTVYGKVYPDELGAATFDVMQQLWRSDQRRSGQLLLAEPLGFLAQDRVLWQAALSGRIVAGAGRWDQRFVLHLRVAAQALASFHSTGTLGLPLRTQQDWLSRAEGALQMLTRVDAPVTPECADVVERLRKASRRIRDEPVVTLHGDFHLGNMVRVGSQVGLIDLDEVRRGSPSQDLGSFAARLLKSALSDGRSIDDAFRLIAVFLEEYWHHAPWPPDREAVDWYTAAYLIGYGVGRSFSTVRMDLDGLGSLIALAGSLIHDGGDVDRITDVVHHAAGGR